MEQDMSATSTPRRTTSLVWQYFTKLGKKGKCRYCPQIISCSAGSSSNLKRHLKSKHPTAYLEMRVSGNRSGSPSTDAEIQEMISHETSSMMSASASDEVQPRKKKRSKEPLLDDARGASQYANSITDSGTMSAEDLFCKFVASELRQMCCEVRQETKANIMLALTEGMRKQSALSLKTVSQTGCQNSSSTLCPPGPSTAHRLVSTVQASPATITPKEDVTYFQSSQDIVYTTYSDALEQSL
ncbi:uncharacterized protein LOC124712503 [Schistocerca piceifrons]|uniref:uncharacterized protein LOC124712503 n=1 Tax=Schistocerca piceifrons TaxID=274613 RepID=UPI001F5EFB3C|nr:uncharacterized protein LOC124712503 [Schistocerca piceifrons]